MTIGLHASLYVSPELLERARADLERLPLRLAVEDQLSALEVLAVLLLRQTQKCSYEFVLDREYP